LINSIHQLADVFWCLYMLLYTKIVSLPVQYICKAYRMKKIILGLLLVFVVTSGYSQLINEETKKRIVTGFDLFNDFWMNTPDAAEVKTFNPGLTFFAVYNFPIKEEKLKFGFGLDISFHNLNSDALLQIDTSGVQQFVKFSELYPDLSYKRNKLHVFYVDLPLEFRLKTEKQFRFSAGFKVGMLAQSSTKYIGDDYVHDTGNEVKYKYFRIHNMESFRYGVYARVGWKWINFYGYYSLSKLFKKDQGPEIYPISAGISLYPF